MSIYGFRSGPAFRGASHADQIVAALDQPMSGWSTFWDQVGGGALESFGLGTVIRDFSIPQGAESRQVGDPNRVIPNLDPITTAQRVYEGVRGIFNPVDTEAEVLSQEDYRASPYFREDVPWDAGMTETRAAALAEWYDRRMVREHFAQFRPITSFLGNFGGQALDPINYIPVAGPAVRGAAAVRFGAIRGLAAVSALDAMANTAAFGLLTRDARAQYGDDVGWQMLTSEIAMSALIGGAFGAIGGAITRRIGQRQAVEVQDRLSTLENTQQARVALNEAIDGMANEGQVSLSPNGARAVDALLADPAVVAELPDGAILTTRGAFQDTRGQGRRFHGSGNPITEISEFSYSSLNYYGQGFYTTDAAADIAFGYANRRGAPQPSIYEIEEIGPVTALDLEQPVPSWLLEPESRGEGQNLISDAADALSEGRRGRPFSTRELFDEIREMGSADGLSADEIQEEFDVLAYRMAEQGYNAMDHVGGLRTRNAEHGVRIYLDPANQIRVAPFDVEGLRVGDAPRALDLSVGAQSSPPDGLSQAAARSARAEDIATEQQLYRVNRETGDYLERGEIEQLREEGRLTDEDAILLDEQRELFDQSQAFARALDAAVTCII